MKSTYKLNIENLRVYNINQCNNTTRAIIKTMLELYKENKELNSTEILIEAIKRGHWSTTQKEEKYYTTFDYYINKNVKNNIRNLIIINKQKEVEEFLDLSDIE